MPAQAIANGLKLHSAPEELSDLCDLEVRLIAQIIPFSKIVTLRGGAYQGVKGNSVCVPIEPDKVTLAVKQLPRQLSDSELIPLKLKRRLRFKGYYMYQVIRRNFVERAFHWLVRNNKLYQSNIHFNRNWHIVSSPESQNSLQSNSEDLFSNDKAETGIKQHEDEINADNPELARCIAVIKY